MSWQCTVSSRAQCLHQHIVHHLIIAPLSSYKTITLISDHYCFANNWTSCCLTITTTANLASWC